MGVEPASLCRLCSRDCVPAVPLFGDPASAGLVLKIRKYLRIQILKDDELPQVTCVECKDQVLDIGTFALMARRTQMKLAAVKAAAAAAIVKQAADIVKQPVETEPSASILHAILTQSGPPTKKSKSSSPPPLVPFSIIKSTSSNRLTIKFKERSPETPEPTGDVSNATDSNTPEETRRCSVVEIGELSSVKSLETNKSTTKSFPHVKVKKEPLDSSYNDNLQESSYQETDKKPSYKDTEDAFDSSYKDIGEETSYKDFTGECSYKDNEEAFDSSYKDVEDEFDNSYKDIPIKEEPKDPLYDSDHESNSVEDAEVRVKQEIMDEDGRDVEEEEEDLEVTLDPMMFLYKEDTNSSDVAIEKMMEVDVTAVKMEREDSGASETALDNSTTVGLIKLKNFSQIRAPRKRPIFVDKRSEPKPYQCAICPRGYFSDIGLQNHLWSHRKILKSSNVVQKKEDVNFWRTTHITASNLLSYNNAMFSTEARYQCPLCNKKINTKSNLRRHLQAHKHRGNHTCEKCCRVFKTKINLTRHMECHESLELSCPECSRVYPTNSTLRAHMISHSDLRPHGCPHCEKTFKRNQDLKFHLNQHTGERPYKCPFCPKTFASSGNCFSHRKRMHPGRKVPSSDDELRVPSEGEDPN